MIDVNYSNRKPVHRLVDYMYDSEKNHLLAMVDEELYWEGKPDEDPSEWTDETIFQYCIQNDLEHVWLDCYMVKQLLEEGNDTELDPQN